MRIISFLFFALCFAGSLHAQKNTIKEVNAANLEVLQVDVKNIYNLNVVASNTNTFKAAMNSEGEFATQMVMNLIEAGSTWNVKVDFAPGFKPTDDKLGAHKVISVNLTLEIPEGKYLMVSGRCLKVELNGIFKQTDVFLDAGNIVARNFSAAGNLSTNEGNIKVYANSDVMAQVLGTSNRVINELTAPAAKNLSVKAANGSIKLRKAKN